MRQKNTNHNNGSISPETNNSLSRFVRQSGRKRLITNKNKTCDEKDFYRTSNSTNFMSTFSSTQNNSLITDLAFENDHKVNPNLFVVSSAGQTKIDQQFSQDGNKENKKFRSDSFSKCQQLRKMVKQNRELKATNQKITQINKKLEVQKNELEYKIKQLDAKLMKFMRNDMKQNDKCTKQSISSESQSNPFLKLKNMKNGGKNCITPYRLKTSDIYYKNTSILDLPSPEINTNDQFQQRFYTAEKNLFEARQQIKRLTLQLDCVRMKAFTDLEHQKKTKHTEYLVLQKKFKDLLNEHIETIKNAKKVEISRKIKTAMSSSIRQNSDMISLWSLSSDESGFK